MYKFAASLTLLQCDLDFHISGLSEASLESNFIGSFPIPVDVQLFTYDEPRMM